MRRKRGGKRFTTTGRCGAEDDLGGVPGFRQEDLEWCRVFGRRNRGGTGFSTGGPGVVTGFSIGGTRGGTGFLAGWPGRGIGFSTGGGAMERGMQQEEGRQDLGCRRMASDGACEATGGQAPEIPSPKIAATGPPMPKTSDEMGALGTRMVEQARSAADHRGYISGGQTAYGSRGIY